MEFLLIYLSLVNVIAFLLMYADKKKAKKGKWRIPEKTLLGFCAIGGSIGGLIGMRLFRHKTKHMAFAVGIPVILTAQLLAAALIWYYIF